MRFEVDSNMARIFDHIDLRVPDLTEAERFYSILLPALGFTRKVDVDGWLQYEAEDESMPAFFGVTESRDHRPNENRIAFWASGPLEVDRLVQAVHDACAKKIEGPLDYAPGYYAVFFEDRAGNRFEICHRMTH